MPSGGARKRSGPPPSPGSGRSEMRKLAFTALPAEGYTGEVPDYPGPAIGSSLSWWAWAWSTPQAALWATPQWSWVIPQVADWCRIKAMLEDPEAPASLWAALRQREGDILLSNDALNRAGYKIATDEVAAKRAETEAPARLPNARERARRLEAVGDDR